MALGRRIIGRYRALRRELVSTFFARCRKRRTSMDADVRLGLSRLDMLELEISLDSLTHGIFERLQRRIRGQNRRRRTLRPSRRRGIRSKRRR